MQQIEDLSKLMNRQRIQQKNADDILDILVDASGFLEVGDQAESSAENSELFLPFNWDDEVVVETETDTHAHRATVQITHFTTACRRLLGPVKSYDLPDISELWKAVSESLKSVTVHNEANGCKIIRKQLSSYLEKISSDHILHDVVSGFLSTVEIDIPHLIENLLGKYVDTQRELSQLVLEWTAKKTELSKNHRMTDEQIECLVNTMSKPRPVSPDKPVSPVTVAGRGIFFDGSRVSAVSSSKTRSL